MAHCLCISYILYSTRIPTVPIHYNILAHIYSRVSNAIFVQRRRSGSIAAAAATVAKHRTLQQQRSIFPLYLLPRPPFRDRRTAGPRNAFPSRPLPHSAAPLSDAPCSVSEGPPGEICRRRALHRDRDRVGGPSLAVGSQTVSTRRLSVNRRRRFLRVLRSRVRVLLLLRSFSSHVHHPDAHHLLRSAVASFSPSS